MQAVRVGAAPGFGDYMAGHGYEEPEALRTDGHLGEARRTLVSSGGLLAVIDITRRLVLAGARTRAWLILYERPC